MESLNKFCITDYFSVSDYSNSWVITIGDKSLDFSDFSYIEISYAKISHTETYEQFQELIDSLIETRLYPLFDWVVSNFSTELMYLILEGWYKVGYSQEDFTFEKLLLIYLSQYGDIQAQSERENVVLKSLIERNYILFLKREVDTWVIVDPAELYNIYHNLKTLFKRARRTKLDKIGLDASVDILLRNLNSEDPVLIQLTHIGISNLSKTYYQSYLYPGTWPIKPPSILKYFRELFRKFLKKVNFNSDEHKQALSHFIRLPRGFVDNLLFQIVNDHNDLLYVLSDDNRDLIRRLIKLIRMIEDHKKRDLLRESLIEFVLSNPDEFFSEWMGKKRYIMRKASFPPSYLTFYRRNPVKRSFIEAIFNEILKKKIINDYITLKLEEEKTVIYVSRQPFKQCKYLLLNMEPKVINTSYSIDEAEIFLDGRLVDESPLTYNIDPITEFQAHCSNLQAWAENNYDTRILHRNLAFPLLKRLTESGDMGAKKVFKQEIIDRFLYGYGPVMEYLHVEGYLKYLELKDIIYIISEAKFDNKQYIIDFLLSEKYVDEEYEAKLKLK